MEMARVGSVGSAMFTHFKGRVLKAQRQKVSGRRKDRIDADTNSSLVDFYSGRKCFKKAMGWALGVAMHKLGRNEEPPFPCGVEHHRGGICGNKMFVSKEHDVQDLVVEEVNHQAAVISKLFKIVDIGIIGDKGWIYIEQSTQCFELRPRLIKERRLIGREMDEKNVLRHEMEPLAAAFVVQRVVFQGISNILLKDNALAYKKRENGRNRVIEHRKSARREPISQYQIQPLSVDLA